MAYRLLIADERTWTKDLRKISPQELKRIFDRIKKLATDPWPAEVQVKKLQHYDLADFRSRVGNYRVLFDRDVEKKEVILYRILHRSKLD